LYIGTENKAFYKSYAIPESKLIFCPYSVDNERFQNEYLVLKNSIPELKRKYGIQENNKVILCTAKYINKKRPLDILQAFKHLNTHGLYYLFMVGEGELRYAMEAYIKEHDLKNVFLTGFVNQSKISEFYSISDLFVMCSEEGETWGLSVNEALNFHLPVVVSDITGCATDLIKTGINGFLFRTGDINDLAEKIKSGLLLNKENVSYTSSIVLSEYSYHSIRKNFSFIA
jgi:glycosyltransferase involved in cell wall biosynthesis